MTRRRQHGALSRPRRAVQRRSWRAALGESEPLTARARARRGHGASRGAAGHKLDARADHSRGFTLIELSIVLFIMAMMMAVAIPGVSALAATSLRESTAMIAGLTREAYARAAITGKVHRIVFDIDNGAFWLERTEDRFVLPSERAEADTHGRGGLTTQEREEAATKGVQQRVAALTGGAGASVDTLALMGLGSAGGGDLDALTQGLFGGALGGVMNSMPLTAGLGVDEDLEETLKKRLRRQAAFSPVSDEIGRAQRLKGDVRFLRVWTEHQKDGFVAGSAELYFFPTGYTERAIITVTDDDNGERILNVQVNALTARTVINDDELEVPRS